MILQSRKAEKIINAYTDFDDVMKGCERLTQYSINDVFTIGRFHQWAEQFVNDDTIDMDADIDTPDEFLEFIDECDY